MDVAVLGAGATGRGIAQVCAAAGHAVALHGEDANVVMDGIDAVQAGLDDAVASGQVTAAERDEAVDSIEGTTGLEAAVGDADLVVDATDGDREERMELFAAVEDVVDAETVVATSATTVSVTAVTAGLRQPGRGVGLHFVDPPAAPLVEVVVADQTTERTRNRAESFVAGLDREAVVVRDAPGFATTRLTLALSVEAMQMLDERVAGVEAIDRAVEVGRDHPVGPLAAADAAGLDARLDELEYLASSLGERFAPPPVLREKVERGDLGRKSGEGFYVWEGGEPVEPSDPDPTPDLRADSPTDPGGP
ncbi:MAG: 3-hydroxyacyl-CoA dehydrogenase family protein [Haloarculaceae archaeon]